MQPNAHDAASTLSSLRRLASKSVRDGMARYAIPSDNAFGVSVGTLRKEAKRIGLDELPGDAVGVGPT